MNDISQSAKILMVIEASGGGSGRHVIDLSHELSDRGYHVHAVYSPERAEKRFEEELRSLSLAKVTTLPMRRSVGSSDLGNAYKLRRIMQSEGPFDVVHAHSSKAGALARIAATAASARVYTPHAFRTMDPGINGFASRAYGGVEKFLARTRTDGVITVSDEEYEHALNLGIPQSKLFLVQNGIRPRDALDRTTLRFELDIPEDAIVVGFVGRMSRQKDPLRFVAAIHAANERNPKILGVMIGDGELFEETQRAAAGRLRLIGNRDARLYLPAFDLVAMTSHYEAMPYSLIESLHAGLPIVATRVGGTSSTLRQGENGITLPVDVSSQEFGRAIAELVSSGHLSTYAAASLTIARSFSAATMTDQTLAVYRTCIERWVWPRSNVRNPVPKFSNKS